MEEEEDMEGVMEAAEEEVEVVVSSFLYPYVPSADGTDKRSMVGGFTASNTAPLGGNRRW